MSSYFLARKCSSTVFENFAKQLKKVNLSSVFCSDKFKLTSSVNMNVVNISPNESIKYAKETQTAEAPSKSSQPDDPDELEHAERSFQEDLKKSEPLSNASSLNRSQLNSWRLLKGKSCRSLWRSTRTYSSTILCNGKTSSIRSTVLTPNRVTVALASSTTSMKVATRNRCGSNRSLTI